MALTASHKKKILANLDQAQAANRRPHAPYVRKEKQKAWDVASLLKQTTEEQSKLTQTAWRELDVMLRKHLRSALRKKGADQLSERGIKDLTVAASTCNIRAYPEYQGSDLGAHVPAKLLASVSERILKSQAIPIDVTPEPLQVVVREDEPSAVNNYAVSDGIPQ